MLKVKCSINSNSHKGGRNEVQPKQYSERKEMDAFLTCTQAEHSKREVKRERKEERKKCMECKQ